MSRWLARKPPAVLVVFAAFCAFAVYCCMYAFRKPFTVAAFNRLQFMGVSYKVWLVTAQVLGYMCSKFYGIRFISALGAGHRAKTIVVLITAAWLALLGFALTPAPWGVVWLLLNGFPLGMVWGVVFSYLEGRRATELMGTVLATSFILASGMMKSAGKWLLLDMGLSEQWMPFCCGAIFLLPMLVATWLLHHVPPPSAADVAHRSVRLPMTAAERLRLLQLLGPGLAAVMLTYVLLTVLRDLRDNFANELWTELGFGASAAVFTHAEIPVSLVVLGAMGSLMLVRSNLKAFLFNHLIIICGFLLALAATLLFSSGMLAPQLWMILSGTGLYISYVPFNCLYFERMIAAFRLKGNVGFLMYLADAFGYLGSVLVLFVKEFWGLRLSWTAFFVQAIWVMSLMGILGTVMAALYFRKKHTGWPLQEASPTRLPDPVVVAA
ncbi:hypothetical protein BUE76_17915 [Cnuella takakiae]|nr:hypothetical protein BUE76_17915 [Cnuella takakiae]